MQHEKAITERKKLSSKGCQKAIFFLRHNNDIDHMVPVIYKWLSSENIPTDVIITTKRNFLNDPRIEYIKKYDHVRIVHINELFKKYSISHIFNSIYFSYNTQIDDLINKSKFVKKKIDKTIKKISKVLFNDVDDGIVVFDWTTTYFVSKIVEIAKNKGFSTISLPHGDRPYYSVFETIESFNYDCLKSYEPSKIFDYVVVPNNLNVIRYEQYMEKDRIKVLGSPRYCEEWMKIIPKFIPEFKLKDSSNKFKIVFFLRNVGYPIFWDELVNTIRLIMQFDEVYLIVKHHPRNANARRLTKQLLKKFPELKNNIDVNLKFIYEGINSVSLLNWADLILDIGTSVTWDAIRQNKPVLMIEYLHANFSTVAHYMKSTEMKSREDLYNSLRKILKNKSQTFYNEKERTRFIKEIIDVPDKYVLERYNNFLRDCFKNN